MSPPRRTHFADEELRAALIASAQQLISRDGPAALTMRSLASEAGCAIGLPYKVFADRRQLVAEILHTEFARLQAAFDELISRAGTATVGANLASFADLLFDSPAVALVPEVLADETLAKAGIHEAHRGGGGPATLEIALADYLTAEKRTGRVDPGVDAAAFGFLLAGALHNLIVSGDAYPRPSRRQLNRWLSAAADRL